MREGESLWGGTYKVRWRLRCGGTEAGQATRRSCRVERPDLILALKPAASDHGEDIAASTLLLATTSFMEPLGELT
jgi:hypothetical protein